MSSHSKLFAIACFFVGLALSSSGCSVLKTLPHGAPSPLTTKASPQPSLEDFSIKKTRQLRIDTARRLAAAGHAEEAVALYLQVEQTEPDKPKFDRQLAPLFAELNLSEKALERYRKALQGSPSDADLRVNYAWALIENQQVPQATAELQSVATVDPSHTGARNALAVCSFRQGNTDAAFEQFKKLHGAAAARHNMAMLCIENQQVDAAKIWVEEAMQDKPLPETEKLASLLHNTDVSIAGKNR